MQVWFQLFLVKSFLLLTSTTVQRCPDDSKQFTNEDKCFSADWANYYREAVDICASYGGIPAKLQNAFENNYVLGFTDFPNDNSYIGVERRGNSTWKYADGSNVTYFNWATSEPNKKNTSLCTVINPRSGKWYAADCTSQRPFFCTIDLYPADASTTHPTPVETTKNPFCQAGWVYNQDTGYCYFLQNFTKADNFDYVLYNWTTAEKKCRSMGAHLVSMHTWDEEMFVNDLIASNASKMPFFPDDDPCLYQYVWIGYYGTGAVGTGNWTDKSKVDYIGFQMPIAENDQWMITNDPSCDLYGWSGCYTDCEIARFACKKFRMS